MNICTGIYSSAAGSLPMYVHIQRRAYIRHSTTLLLKTNKDKLQISCHLNVDIHFIMHNDAEKDTTYYACR